MRLITISLFAAGLSIGVAAAAHTVWLEAAGTPGDYKVLFGGHEGKLEGYPPAKLKEIVAYNAAGKMLKVTRQAAADSVTIHVAGQPALITAHFDNGIYSKTPEGRSVNTPMDQTPGAVSAVDAIKYHKTIVRWVPFVTRPLGQPIEVVPLTAAAPKAGQAMKVRVLIDGKPAAGMKLGRGEEKVSGEMTDAQGVASFVPTAGFNKLWAGKRTPVTGNAHYTELSYEFLLGFTAQ